MKKLFTIILFLTAIVANAQQRIVLSRDTFTVEAGQYQFQKPRVSVRYGTEDISSHFYLNYFIKGQENNVTIYDNKQVTQNPITGTRISMLYGIVFIGDKTGRDTIKIIATPRDAQSAATYHKDSTYYYITIPKQTPKVKTSQKRFIVHTNQLFGYPEAKLYRDSLNGTDITSYYDVSYSHSSGLTRYTNWFIVDSVLKAPASTNRTEWITMRYTPKSEYADLYEPWDTTYQVRVEEYDSSKSIQTHLDWNWTGGKFIQAVNSAEDVMPYPVVRDDNGNDVSRLMRYTYTPLGTQEQINNVITNIYTTSNEFYKTWRIHFGYQVNDSLIIQMTYTPITDIQQTDPATYVTDIVDSIYVQGRRLQWTFNVTPSTYNIYESNLVLDRSNWQLPTFNVFNPQGQRTDGGFQRRIAFPVGTFSGNDNGNATGDTITYKGIKYVVRVAENYTFQLSYGDWKIDYTNVYDSLIAHDAPFMLFTVYIWNAGQEEAYKMYTDYRVIPQRALPTRIVLSEYQLSANVNDSGLKGFTKPTATVRDDNGNNVTPRFNLSYAITQSSGLGSSFSIDSDGNLTYTRQEGEEEDGQLTVTVSGTVKSDYTKQYVDTLPKPVTYIVNVHRTTFDYEVVTDAMTTDNDSVVNGTDIDVAHHGKLHFIKDGYMAAGTVINDMAGLSVQFGAAGDADWRLLTSNAYKDEEGSVKGYGRVYTEGAPVDIDNNEIPISGTFAILRPHVNGFLTIDGRWVKGNRYRLIRVRNGQIVGTVDYQRNDGDQYQIGEIWMNTVLMAGEVYYLYNYGADDGTNEPSELHGFNFTPAFVRNSTDHEAIRYATTFVNGYVGSIPSLLSEATDGVSVKAEDLQSGNVNDYVGVDSSIGTITPKKRTVDIETKDNVVNRVKIIGTVTNANRSASTGIVTQEPYFYLFITDLPTYIVQDGETPSAGERVTTTNIATKITMTYGGWINGSGPYIYKNANLFDSWGAAKTDTVGQNNRTIDGFDFASQGTQNPRDEDYVSFQGFTNGKANASTIHHDPWDVPCRGTYIKFDPEENGTLIVYLLQNGAIDYTGSRRIDDLREGYQMKFRPLYIIDEAAQPVTLDNSWTIEQSLLPSNNNQASHPGSYTEGLYRSTWNDDWIKNKLDSLGLTGYKNNPSKYSDCPYDLSRLVNRDADLDSIMTQWQKYANYNDTEHARQEIIHLASGGYTLISKAFVRYSFQVKAGKSYYLLMNGSKLSPCGFAFVPNWFKDNITSLEDAPAAESSSLKSNVNFKSTLDSVYVGSNTQSATNVKDGDIQDIDVTLDREFGRNRWTSICLPFSMSEAKFKQFFGDDASVITYDSIDVAGTGYFTQHVVHNIVANRPYFICPSKFVNAGTVIKDVTVESGYNTAETLVDSIRSGYQATGIYDEATIDTASYVFAGSSIYRTKTPLQLGAGRAYLHKVAGTAAKRLLTMAVTQKNGKGNNTTGIKDVIEYDNPSNNPRLKSKYKGVYNLKGQKVAEELSPSLPQGIYVVNGDVQLLRR